MKFVVYREVLIKFLVGTLKNSKIIMIQNALYQYGAFLL
ncbi:hypothetical protein K004_4033 [Acinetobacter baumannii 16553_8]|nr:hypothetical protein K004_4033 [Acinetobacter baumannii 16553_8]EYS60435.1 hypothetical protein K002_4099 [Acinetobacter baumannii 16553_6]EYS68653.1 hypothetical protein J999_4075 [Acinetobacter baumannii 16553_3]EYT16031.1 hypothetical protein J592_02759 [Acinetobacter baumannii 655378]KCY88960.1 hypothetical protein J729_4230 [Acinetobacter baumannii 929679-598]